MKKILMAALAWPAVCFAAHPLVTDDTGTQGRGGFQFELNADRTRDDADGLVTRSTDANATLTYGWTDNLDVALTIPYQRNATTSLPAESGIGDASAAMKWRFWQQAGFGLALKPQVSFPTGSVQRGLGNGRAAYGVDLLAGVDQDEVTLLADIGGTLNANASGARRNRWNVSAAALWKIEAKTCVLLDAGVYRHPDPASRRNPAFMVVGMIYSAHDKLDLDVGYRRGLNRAETKHGAGVGMTLRW